MRPTELETFVETIRCDLFHGTNVRFEAFRTDRASYFFFTRREGEAAARRVESDIVVEAEFHGTVAQEDEALAIWNEVNPPQQEYIYSMLCRQTREYPLDEILRFEGALRSRGIDAVRHVDYDPVDRNQDAWALAVLNIDRVTIKKVGG